MATYKVPMKYCSKSMPLSYAAVAREDLNTSQSAEVQVYLLMSDHCFKFVNRGYIAFVGSVFPVERLCEEAP